MLNPKVSIVSIVMVAVNFVMELALVMQCVDMMVSVLGHVVHVRISQLDSGSEAQGAKLREPSSGSQAQGAKLRERSSGSEAQGAKLRERSSECILDVDTGHEPHACFGGGGA